MQMETTGVMLGQGVWVGLSGVGCTIHMVFCPFASHFILFINYVFTLNPDCSFPPSSPPSTPPHPLPFPFSSEKASHGYLPALAYQTAVRLGASSPIKARRGSPVRGEGPKGRKKSQRQPLLLVLGILHEDRATQSIHAYSWFACVDGLDQINQVHAPWLVVQSLSSPMGPG